MAKIHKYFWGFVILFTFFLLFSSPSFAVANWPGNAQPVTATCTVTNGVITKYCENSMTFNGQQFAISTAKTTLNPNVACRCILDDSGLSLWVGYDNPVYGETGYKDLDGVYHPVYYGNLGSLVSGYYKVDVGNGYCYYANSDGWGPFETQIGPSTYLSTGLAKTFGAVGFCSDLPGGGTPTNGCYDYDYNTSKVPTYFGNDTTNTYLIPDLLVKGNTTDYSLNANHTDSCSGNILTEWACTNTYFTNFWKTFSGSPTFGDFDCNYVNSSGYYTGDEANPQVTGASCVNGACACPSPKKWLSDGTCGCALDPSSKQFKIIKNGETVAGIDKYGVLWAKGQIFENSNPDTVTGKIFKIKGSAYSCGADWTTQMHQPGAGVLLSISYLNQNNGLAAGLGGQIFRTTNAGSTWVDVSSGISSGVTLYSVSYPTSTYAYAVGSLGKIYGSSAGGAYWTEQKTVANTVFEGVAFKDSTTGFAVGGGNSVRAIYFTNNKGITWIADIIPLIPLGEGTSGGQLTGVAWAGTNKVFVVGTAGTLFMNTNPIGTGNWQNIGWSTTGLSSQEHLMGVYFIDANTGWAVGYDGNSLDGIILKTTDGGVIWTKIVYSTSSRPLKKVYFSDANKGIIVGDSIVLETIDGGITWDEITGNLADGPSDISYKSGSEPTVVGSNNLIAKKVVGSLCTTIATFDSSGNLYLKGILTQGASSITPTPGTKNFIIKSNGDNKLIIDQNGNLITKGCAFYSIP